MGTRRKLRKSKKRKSRRGGMFKSSPNKIPVDENKEFTLLTLQETELSNQKDGEGKNITVWVVRGNRYIEGYLTYYKGKYYLYRDDDHGTGYLLIDTSDLIYKCSECVKTVYTDVRLKRDNFIRQIRDRKKSSVKDEYYDGQFPNPIYIETPKQSSMSPEIEYAESKEQKRYNQEIVNENEKISRGNDFVGEAMLNISHPTDVERTKYAQAYITALQTRATLERKNRIKPATYTPEEIKMKKKEEANALKAYQDYLSQKTQVGPLVHSQVNEHP